jgi:signal transduction histidine kinase
MKATILTLELRYEQDLVLTRQRARQLTDLLGFDALEQTRIATAVSEIARTAFQHAGGGIIRFGVEEGAPPLFVVQIQARGPASAGLEALLEGENNPEAEPGIAGARRLVDQFQILSSPEGTTVRLGKEFPRRSSAVTAEDLARITRELERRKPQNPVEEIQQQNQELLRTLSELRTRQVEVERLNSELQETNRGIVALYAELTETAQRKDEFLAMLAHELRNPLAPLSKSLQLLRGRGGDPTTVEQTLDVMERQVRHLTRLIDDLLDVSRIAGGKVHLRYEPLDLVALVQATVEDCWPAFDPAALTLALDLPPGPIMVNGDSTRLAQVLSNLLSNAVKFTEPGGQIIVRLWSDAAQHCANVSVQDTGIGIAPELLPRVFDSFMQADRSLDRSRGGLGLGLSVVKSLVEMHGGEISARSEGIGRGAEFMLSLPWELAASAPAAAGRSPAARARPLRILVVEDNRDTAETMRELLELCGHEVAVKFTGLEGVAAARRLQPQVVLCDLGLPDMDGYAVAAALRQESELASTYLVAVTGYGREEDRRRCREAGFDQHLVKPVDFAVLMETLAASPGSW